MSADTDFIKWVGRLDADIEREYTSHESDEQGHVVSADLQETLIGDRNMALIGRLTHLRVLNLSGNPDITDDGLRHLENLTATRASVPRVQPE